MKYLYTLLLSSFAFSAVSQDLSSQNDEFNDAQSISQWKLFHETEQWNSKIKKMDVNTTEKGCLYLEPYSSGWYADLQAPFLYKEITGDFDVRAKIKVKGKNTEIPQALWSLAGLMVRQSKKTTSADWQPKSENWMFITTGIAEDPKLIVLETKNTLNSASSLKLRPSGGGWMELRIVRIGSSFILMYKLEKDKTWTIQERFYRPMLPATLQVGLNAYTDYQSIDPKITRDNPFEFNKTNFTQGKPDLVLLVDYIRFNKPKMTLQKSDNVWYNNVFHNNLTDYSISNEKILSMLGN